MMTLGVPQCVPVFTRDQQHHTDSLPKYLVVPGNLAEFVEQDDMHIKILDLGEGSPQWSQLRCWTLNSHSILQCRNPSRPAHPVTGSGTGGHLQSSLDAAQYQIQHASRHLVNGMSGTQLKNERDPTSLTLH